jgi:DNA-binding GntR family transcriptional regulator
MRVESAEASLPRRLAVLIRERLRTQAAPRGTHLAEQGLADALGVSRSPVRRALAVLAAEGAVEQVRNRGFFLAQDAVAMPAAATGAADPDEALYARVIEDRLAGRLGAHASERALLARYGVPRARLLTVLGRAEAEGWVERRRGRGWSFPPVIDSAQGYENGYRFRLLVEPAALLEPGFNPDPQVLGHLRARQEHLLGPGLAELSRAALFDLNAAFHEGLIALAGNPFLLEGLQRVNRLRRPVEYRLYADHARLRRMAEEHLRILDLMERDEREVAAALMRAHLARSRAARRAALGEHPADA